MVRATQLYLCEDLLNFHNARVELADRQCRLDLLDQARLSGSCAVFRAWEGGAQVGEIRILLAPETMENMEAYRTLLYRTLRAVEIFRSSEALQDVNPHWDEL